MPHTPQFQGKAKAPPSINTQSFTRKPIVYRALCPTQTQGISLSSAGEAQRPKHKLWQLRERAIAGTIAVQMVRISVALLASLELYGYNTPAEDVTHYLQIQLCLHC